MNKKKWIKKILYLSYILTLSAVLISCSKKEGKNEGSYSNTEEKDSESNYRNSFVPKRGYGNLEFNKVSETEVHLLEVEEIDKVEDDTNEQIQDGQLKEEQLKKEQIKDYGALTIAADDIHVVPESMEDFPYYQWDYDYTISQSNSEATNVKVMEQIPNIEVSVGDTKLNYVGSKIDWNGEKEDTIEFHELMDDTIPMFNYPNIAMSYTEDICLTINDVVPTKISVTDYLITEDGQQQYDSIGAIERAIRYDKYGNYYVGLVQHTALFLSLSSGDKQICEYVFVLSVAPQWKEEN